MNCKSNSRTMEKHLVYTLCVQNLAIYYTIQNNRQHKISAITSGFLFLHYFFIAFLFILLYNACVEVIHDTLHNCKKTNYPKGWRTADKKKLNRVSYTLYRTDARHRIVAIVYEILIYLLTIYLWKSKLIILL